tara:strand:+ start:497 stop:1093 length:597 start_codon:yes stop_codon:yes gene_type:complete
MHISTADPPPTKKTMTSRCVITLQTMARKRGFKIQGDQDCAELLTMFHKHLLYRNDAQQRLLVLLLDTRKPKVTVAHTRHLQKWLEANPISQIVLVSVKPPTPTARDELHALHAQHYCYNQLLIDITEHALVPLHRQLSANETRDLLHKLNTPVDKLPRLLDSDPVCRFYNFPLGAVIAIERRNGAQQGQVYYRRVTT